jgi:hypothetical protein
MGTVLCNFYYNPAITGTGEKKLSRSRDPLAYFLNKLSTHTAREREGESQEREERRTESGRAHVCVRAHGARDTKEKGERESGGGGEHRCMTGSRVAVA